MTPQEQKIVDDLNAANALQVKTAGEIAALKEGSAALIANVATLESTVASLQAQLDAAGIPSQELLDAVAAVKTQAGVNDGLIPDLAPV